MSLKITILDQNLSSSIEAFESLSDYTVRATLLAETIRSELLSLRGGNAHTKNRGEVRGGGKKPWKQKGTGRARHGSTRSPIWVGGGVVHGPRNDRNWHRKINKTARLACIKSILKDRLAENCVYQFQDSFTFDKTKIAVETLSNLNEKTGLKDKNYIILYTASDKPNIQGFLNTEVKMMNATNLKLYVLASSKSLVMTPTARKFLEEKVEK